MNRFKGMFTRRAQLWTVLTVFSVLMMTPVLLIQFNQARLIRELTNTQYDSMTWQFFQLEREQAKLLRLLDRVRDVDAQTSSEELVERYEIYVSRMVLIKDFQSASLVEGSPAYPNLLKELDAIVKMADPLFSQPENLLARRNELAEVSKRLLALDPLLREMSLEASQASVLFLEERNQQILQQGKALIALTMLQVLLLLCLAWLVVRQFNRQKAQYLSLKALTQDLESAKKEAERSNQAKSVFLANMSHEIRTPFQGLMGMLNLVSSTDLNNAQRDHVETALDSAQHLLSLLNDILDISTIDSGAFKLSISTMDFEELTTTTEDLMRQAAVSKSIYLRVEYDDLLPRWVSGDAVRIRQILFNLIGNAIKFTHQGQVCVTVKQDSQGVVRIVVEDTGEGMDAATLERLFTRFYQADSTFMRKNGGTGLGLEISRSLARMMGGDITVTSQLGVGSRFEVTLNLPEAAAPASAGDQLKMEHASHQSLKLLVAEDHPINLKYMDLLLTKMGHEAVFCGNGLEALELLKLQTFDAVLLDYHMPELDGISTAKAIRRMNSSSSDIKIMLVTADVVGEVKIRAQDAGIDRFVTKPLTFNDLNMALLGCGLLIPDVQKEVGLLAPGELTSVLENLDRQFPLVVDLSSYKQLVPLTSRKDRADLLSMALSPTTGSLDVLMKEMTGGEQKAIVLAAHNLKGASMLLGLSGIASAAAEIETSAAELSAADVARWKAKLRHLRERSKDEVSSLELMMDEMPQAV